MDDLKRWCKKPVGLRYIDILLCKDCEFFGGIVYIEISNGTNIKEKFPVKAKCNFKKL